MGEGHAGSTLSAMLLLPDLASLLPSLTCPPRSALAALFFFCSCQGLHCHSPQAGCRQGLGPSDTFPIISVREGSLHTNESQQFKHQGEKTLNWLPRPGTEFLIFGE